MKFEHSVQLIILPGWGGDASTWAPFVRQAQAYFDVRVIELPCFGSEPCPETVWSVEDYAEFVMKRIQRINDSKSKTRVLLGHSFGGQVAALAVSKYPELCAHLILSAPAIIRPKRSIKQAILRPFAVLAKYILRFPPFSRHEKQFQRLAYRLINSPDYLETDGIKREIFKRVITEDVTGELKKIPCPTTLVWGTDDRYTPPRYAKKIIKLMPNIGVHMIAKAGHGIHLSQPHRLMHIVRKAAENISPPDQSQYV